MNRAFEYSDLNNLSLTDLRQKWVQYWGCKPHARIGRKMLEESLLYKMREQSGQGLSSAQQRQLNTLMAEYKRNPYCFDERSDGLKLGTRLVRTYKGKRHTVEITPDGYLYNAITYKSLSKIAKTITGTSWNGWVFFGLKNVEEKT